MSSCLNVNLRDAPFVLGVHIGPVVQQELHHRHSVVTSSKVKRSGVSSLEVPAVHVLSCAQRLQRETSVRLHVSSENTQQHSQQVFEQNNVSLLQQMDQDVRK